MHGASLSPRQEREIAYHRDYARSKAEERTGPVAFDVVDSPGRRWWNAYWTAYTLLMRRDLKGLRVLAPGCGFGEDAVRLARLGAEVEAFDISPDVIDVARTRAARHGYQNVNFSVSPCEKLGFPDGHFDVAVFFDILHHVDIPQTLAETRRVLKPGGRVVGNELYTHSLLQKGVRESPLVRKALYPAMKKFIYGGRDAYITQDERKIDETEIAFVERACQSIDLFYFNGIQGRLFPDRWPFLSKADRLLMQAAGPLGRVLAGRVVFDGVVAK